MGFVSIWMHKYKFGAMINMFVSDILLMLTSTYFEEDIMLFHYMQTIY